MPKHITIPMFISTKLASLSCWGLSVLGFVFLFENKIPILESILLSVVFLLIFCVGIMTWIFADKILKDE